MSEWQTVAIGEICDLVTSGGTPLTSQKEYYHNGSIPWVKTKEVNQCRLYGTENHITQLGLDNSSAKLIPENSIIIAMYGDGKTAGRVALNKVPVTTNQACCNLILNKQKANYDFVFYNLMGRYDELVSKKTGSGQQNLNGKIIKEIEIDLPSLPEQKAIASVLSSLDDKIDLLHRQNKTLEAMAETLFRQWFIEEAKEDWEDKPLSSIATFTNGLACQKYPPQPNEPKLPVLKIKDLTSGISDSSDWATANVDPKYIVNHGDVIFAWSASLMVKIWSGETCVLNQHLFNVTSDEYPKWFFYQWCKYHLEEFISISQSHATTMGHIKRKDLDEAIVKVPSQPTLQEMTTSFEPLMDKLITNLKQIQTLEKLRDTLLPKLMSGEVRVQYQTEDVA
ncbi:restriction endonuclease subunit S [Acinetobacter baumannii]|uniref:restriction endonuclease subunit S n=1 Tax=Acinetobacter baumannii TaxID=470 RepID=UPI0022858B6E|nr:restriction endonuclease subunit S [Acinetobacter baumannii]MCZ0697031.1 restriction endonuclease subunit S [Acinetobacter baumannii]HDU8503872.1 restriction endonuclease subunit S [Acinetobacter baumannii]